MGTAVVGIALAGIVALIIRKMIRDKKNGKSIQCGGDCKQIKYIQSASPQILSDLSRLFGQKSGGF